jgi:hypothetical protein
MQFKDRQKIIDKLENDLTEIKSFTEEDHFISAYFHQFMSGMNEYSDNSMELAETYKQLKAISEDETFMRKLKYVLDHYA